MIHNIYTTIQPILTELFHVLLGLGGKYMLHNVYSPSHPILTELFRVLLGLGGKYMLHNIYTASQPILTGISGAFFQLRPTEPKVCTRHIIP
jgi:hypothetical protein